MKINNAAPSSATFLYVDILDRFGTDISVWLDAMDDSTNTANRGTIKLVQISDPSKIAVFDVTGAVVNGTGYRKIPITPIFANGTFTNAATLAFGFTRTGNKGADGIGAGDVIGPTGAVDTHVALFDGSTGKLIKDGGALAAVATAGTAISLANTPAGNIAATNVQAAINELDVEKQPLDATLTALAGVTTAADKLIYATGVDAFGVTDLSAFARTFLDDAAATNVLTTLGVSTFIKTLLDDVDAATALATLGAQASDVELTALAGLTSAANKLPYFTGSGTAALADLTAFVRTLLDDADASTFLTTLGISTFVKTLLDDTTAAAFMTTLGGTTVGQALFTAATAAAARTAAGLLWTPASAARPGSGVAAIDMAIPTGCSMIRLGGAVQLPTSQSLSMIFSFDGGSTFPTGASDYVSGYSYQSGTTLSGGALAAGTNFTVMQSNSNAALIKTPIDVNIGLGGSSLCSRIKATTIGYVSSEGVLTTFHGYSASTTRPTHLRLYTSAAGNMAVGTEIILEASNG